EAVARRLQGITQTIVVKPNLRPFEKAGSGSTSSPSEMTETKSAPTIVATTPDQPPVQVARWVWPTVIAGFAVLLMIIFNLMSQRSPNQAAAEELWIAAFEEPTPPVQIAAAKALGKLGQSSETAAERLLAA